MTYGPDDTWPDHQKHWWNEVLPAARSARWTLDFINSPHTWGWVSCPTGACTFKVDKTARAADSWAKAAGRKVTRCKHGSGDLDDDAALLQRSANLLEVVIERLDVADDLLERIEDHTEALAEVDRLEMMLDTAEVNLTAIERDVEEAVDRVKDAEVAVNDLHPEDIASALTEAHTAWTKVAQLIAHHELPSKEQIREVLAATRTRHAALTERLERASGVR